MLYILSAREYKDLIHKDRIRQPVKQFEDALRKLMTENSEMIAAYYRRPGADPSLVRTLEVIKTEITTLLVKLDL